MLLFEFLFKNEKDFPEDFPPHVSNLCPLLGHSQARDRTPHLVYIAQHTYTCMHTHTHTHTHTLRPHLMIRAEEGLRLH